jgi:hypothetical protein
MFYCPNCEVKVYPEVTIKNIPAEYSVNIFTNSISLALCSLGNFTNLDVEGYRCPGCGKVYDQSNLFIRSMISNKMDKLEHFIIVSIKNKKEEYVGNKLVLVIPPKVIHESELEKFKEYNPYKDDKYLVINKLNKITISIPK